MISGSDNNHYYLRISRLQRNLLLEYRDFFCDDDVYRHISIALREGSNYRLLLSYADLEEIEAIALDIIHQSDNLEIITEMNALIDIIWSADARFCPEPEVDELALDAALSAAYGNRLEKVSGSRPVVWSPCYNNRYDDHCFILRIELNDNTWRRVIVPAHCTLAQLHETIFQAFNRYDRHLYSFYLPVRAISKPQLGSIRKNSVEFTLSCCVDPSYANAESFPAEAIQISQLGLNPRKIWWYLFDFNDQWLHRIVTESVTAMQDKQLAIPAILDYAGKAPRQYPV
ncbi:MAG: plasmid pRiA4b ORF-3 family protein [Sedimentisphaerales bacterium]|nr:plasmid pRiA4b ORF-3 family protein [Sedimentisphaerales bacterium]